MFIERQPLQLHVQLIRPRGIGLSADPVQGAAHHALAMQCLSTAVRQQLPLQPQRQAADLARLLHEDGTASNTQPAAKEAKEPACGMTVQQLSIEGSLAQRRQIRDFSVDVNSHGRTLTVTH